jgi:hypothetical protein
MLNQIKKPTAMEDLTNLLIGSTPSWDAYYLKAQNRKFKNKWNKIKNKFNKVGGENID